MSKRINRQFYLQPTLKVAKELLGKYFIYQTRQGKLVGKIVETEAYLGPQDRASHAFGNKKTLRNQAEYLKGGHIYIYLVYGMYWQLNISTASEGKPECVLIRSLEPIEGISQMAKNRKIEPFTKSGAINPNLTNGPGKLCQAMKLDKSHYGLDLVKSGQVYLEDRGEKILKSAVKTGPRIGIDYAGSWKNKPWRFYFKNSCFVSQP